MKGNYLKVCLIVTLGLFAVRTYAEDACDCYMEYQNLETEAKVYADEESRDASLTEFSLKEKMEIQEATALLAEF